MDTAKPKPRVRKTNSKIEDSAAVAVKTLADAAKEASTVVANAAENATRAIASAAAEAIKVSNVQGSCDHDLLIELKTLMTVMQVNVNEIKTGTAVQILDHEQRLKKCENKTANYFIVNGIYTLATVALIGLVITHILNT